MRLDGHIHLDLDEVDQKDFVKKLHESDIDGGLVISEMPDNMMEHAKGYKDRVNKVITVCEGNKHLFPFFFINPLNEDAKDQIDYAVEKGVKGFKIICNKFSVDNPKCVEVYKYIAKKNKPILFHSGILWDGKNASGKYNKPTEFEVLLQIEDLRFCLAHISWPWINECVAVFGKFINAKSKHKQKTAEMFIDITPGTPEIYRKDALTKLYKVGYDVENNVIFGLDNCANHYSVDWAKNWQLIDDEIYNELNLSEIAISKIYSDNLIRFIGE